MQPEKLKETFDQQALSYDKQSAKIAPIHKGLHFLMEAVFSDLPRDARVMCVGVGTGAELVHLAKNYPQWKFTAIDPSGAMLHICRAKAEKMGFVERCHFHEGYVDSLPINDTYDAATCFLVSQFILPKETRSTFFHSIAKRLKRGGILVSSDLASDVHSKGYEALLKEWCYMMTGGDCTPERLTQMQATYDKNVSILPPLTVAAIIEAGGFETPVQFFQAGLIHAWHSRRTSPVDE